MATWIDFKALRSKLSFADVLRHYGVEVKVKGDRAMGLCPLPGHPGRDDGRPRTASLSVNLTRNIFQCFGCKASGNVLEFCALMEGLDPAQPAQFRAAALKVASGLGLVNGASATPVRPPPAAKADGRRTPAPVLPTVVNAPLDFELKHLDPDHAYLKQRGLDAGTVRHFGLGYCAKGIMEGRIAIPLHDVQGRLLGYAGRRVDEAAAADAPKYLFPSPRERNGNRYEFHKSELLYNGHRIEPDASELIVVEGFWSVWWLHQHGYPNTVALMGSSLSATQARLLGDLIAPGGRIWLLPDGDPAGAACAVAALTALAPDHFVRWAKLPGGQPTDLDADDLARLLLLE